MSEPVLMAQQAGIADLLGRAHTRFLDCSKMSMEEAERLGELLAVLQRDVGFLVGDLAKYTESRWPDTHHQCYPPWISPGLLARNAGVCRAFPTPEDRLHECTYSQYLQVAGMPNRQELLVEMAGQTTDESRKQKRTLSAPTEDSSRPRWLLSVDCNLYLHRWWHSGAGCEAAMGVASLIGRTANRLKAKGLTDLACCFDSTTNHRKALTEDWEDKYKGNRGPKDPELINQINLLRDLLGKAGFATITLDGMEADDVMASLAKQFKGKVTLLTQDKDMRQCLSDTCNILLSITFQQDETSGDMLPGYQWLSAKQHAEETGIPPGKWVEFQILSGDKVDGITGVVGTGQAGAKDLIREYGTADATIEAAKKGDEYIRPKKRAALIEFEPKLEITRKLVTLRDDLFVPSSTRI